MSQFRLARLCLMLAAVGLSAAPALMTSAHAQKNKSEPAAQAPQADTVRPELFKLLDPAQLKPLLDAKNYADVQTRITQAEAVADKTPYEVYVVNRMKLSLALASKNDALAIPALEAAIASGKVPAAEQADYYQSLANMYINTKNYPKALEWLKRYQAQSATPETVRPTLIRLYYASGDDASAKAELLTLIADSEKAGKTPSQEDLRLLASAALKLKDDPTYLVALEKLASYYPSDDFWRDLISRGVLRKPGFDVMNNQIEVYRLEYAAIKKLTADEFVDLAELALQAGFPTEAKQVVERGFADGVLGTGANAAKQRQLRDRASKGAADDAKNIAGGEASAAKSKNGAGLVNIGWAYVTMGQYDKGIGFIEQGIAKGGLKQPDDAKLRLAMAQVKAGRKAEAIKAFESVKASGGLSDLAKHWILLLNHPSQGSVAPVAGAK